MSGGEIRIYRCSSGDTCPQFGYVGVLKNVYVCLPNTGCLDKESRIDVRLLDRSDDGNSYGWKYVDDIARLQTVNFESKYYVNLVSFSEFELKFETKINEIVLVGFPFLGLLMKKEGELVEVGSSGNEYMVPARNLAKLFTNIPPLARKTVMIANVTEYNEDDEYSKYKVLHDGGTWGGTSGAIGCVVGYEYFCVGIHVGGQPSDGGNTFFTTDHPFFDTLCDENVQLEITKIIK